MSDTLESRARGLLFAFADEIAAAPTFVGRMAVRENYVDALTAFAKAERERALEEAAVVAFRSENSADAAINIRALKEEPAP